MKHLMESVPNFSEGRRPEIIGQIVDAARAVAGARILDVHSDADHNRSVLTVAGEAASVEQAVYAALVRASELIDLRLHSGAHPRIGATDVVPFVPLEGTSMDEAIATAYRFGRRVAEELNIPVYFYEEAATSPERRNLEFIRRGGFEGLRTSIALEEDRAPDVGPRQVHPSAGAVVVGARGPLIAYNIYLNTTDLSVAQAIARTVRHSSGGLRHVKALGLDIPARGQVQVSLNLTDYRRSAMQTVFNLVRSEAETYGLTITKSELVGLVPLAALVDAARFSLRLHDFVPEQILEVRLMENDD